MNTEEKIENPDFNKEINGEEKSETAVENAETSNELNQQTLEDPQEKLEKTISELNDKILRLLAENQNLRKNHRQILPASSPLYVGRCRQRTRLHPLLGH